MSSHPGTPTDDEQDAWQEQRDAEIVTEYRRGWEDGYAAAVRMMRSQSDRAGGK